MTLKEKLAWEFNYMLKLSKTPSRLAQYLLSKFHSRLGGFKQITHLFAEKKGLEIGGPSPIFRKKGYIPLYPLAKQVDGCNFSTNTVWENTIAAGLNYKTGDGPAGYQYILDGTDLSIIPSESYDFILSSHSLEHIANPLKALTEWLRVIKSGGALTLILPDSRYTFDNKRPITRFEHLLNDYNNNTNESDLTHLEEIVALHDFELDGGVKSLVEFKQRSLNNIDNRCLHHHVYDLSLLKQLFNHFNVKIITSDASFPHHLTIIGVKQ